MDCEEVRWVERAINRAGAGAGAGVNMIGDASELSPALVEGLATHVVVLQPKVPYVTWLPRLPATLPCTT